MSRYIISLAAMLAAVFTLFSCGKENPDNESYELIVREEPFFSEGMELMGLLWRLSGSSEYNQCDIAAVNESADEYFSSMLGHDAVNYAKIYREKCGICYDAVAAYGLHLRITEKGKVIFDPNYVEYENDVFYTRWTAAQREKMLGLVNDFYKKSDFAGWYKSIEPLYEKARQSFKDVCDVDYDWYDSFFGTLESPRRQINLSFFAGLNNYGLSVMLPEGDAMLSPVISCAHDDGSEGVFYNDEVIEIIIHEFCHPYCNPLIDKYWDDMKAKADAAYRKVSTQMKEQAYGSSKIMMYETFVRSSVIRYMLSHYDTVSKEDLVAWQESLGFLLVGPMVDALELREENASQYKTMEDFMPTLISAL